MLKAPEVVTVEPRPGTPMREFELSDHLEQGRIVFFPTPPLALPSQEDLGFLRSKLPERIRLKNVSYYPEADRVYGLKSDRETFDRTSRILKDHHHQVADYLRESISSLVSNWVPGTTSFRPLQERGRVLSRHASNELIHVDAGAYGATHGARILRFFTNIHTTEPRVWKVKGTFPDLLAEFGTAAGIPSTNGDDPLREGTLDRFYSGFIRSVSQIVPMARSLDTSPYDRAMRRFHNFMKGNDSFQKSDDGARVMSFPPMSCWMVFTDMVGHACISGQHMLSNTYLVPLENCRQKALTPYFCLRTGHQCEEA